MKSVRCVSLFAVLMVLLIATQSPPAAYANQPDAPSQAQNLPAKMAALSAPVAQKPPVSFAKAVAYNAGGYYAYSIAIGDVNGDGHPDLVVADSLQCGNCTNGGVSVLLGNGDGTFQAPVTYSSGGYNASSVAIGDVNGDGHPDLVIANQCQSIDQNGNCLGPGEVGVLLGNGDGTFQAPITFNSSGYSSDSVAIADLNGDGHLDLVVANQCADTSCVNGSVSVLLGNGDGTFQAPVGYNSGGYTTNSVVIGDLNGDGHPDLVVANECQDNNCSGGYLGIVGVLLGNGDGTFQAAVTYNTGGYVASSVAIGDLNGDGHPDLVVANQCVDSNCANGSAGVLLGNGDGTFQTAVGYSSGGYIAASVAITDLNGDGKLDLAIANYARTITNHHGELSVLPGNGDGTFQAPVIFSSAGYDVTSVALADVNRDGKSDALAANGCFTKSCGSAGVGVLLNDLTAMTATALTSSPNPSLVNQSVTFTATITSDPPIPDGEVVTFHNGKTNLGTSTTTNGVASLTTSFSKAKTYTVKATYPGDAFHKASKGTVKQVVNP